MIPKNKIIDDYEIKLPNKIRDDSLIKFCKENNCNDHIATVHTDEKGVTKESYNVGKFIIKKYNKIKGN